MYDSDSESVFEVPIPPKPKPVVINLQDSGDEDAGSSIDEDDLLQGRLHGTNAPKVDSNSRASSSSPEVEIIEVSHNRQDTTARSKTTHISPRKKSAPTTTNDESTSTFNEIIVLNCTMIQKGAKNTNEIKQLSKSAEQDRIGTSVEDISKRSKDNASQDASEGDGRMDCAREPQKPTNLNLYKNRCISVEKRKEITEQTKRMEQNIDTDKADETYNISHSHRHAMQSLKDTLLEVSCGSNDNLVVNQKRPSEGNSGESGGDKEAECNSPARKRQCTVHVGGQLNVAPTPCSSGSKTERNESFWTEYFFKPLPEKLKRLYNDSRGQENFDVHEIQRSMPKDPNMWLILDQDLMPSPPSKRGRYWSTVRCNNCQQDGHAFRDCLYPFKERICYMCGVQGHEAWCCPKQHCLTCGKKQNTYLKTCVNCRKLRCTMCFSIGHRKERCPDLWRRYHQVTKEIRGSPRVPGNVMKPASQLYCCNCSKRGHESSTCTEYRWSQHFPTPAFVTNYTDGPMYQLETRKAVAVEKNLTNVETANVSLFGTRSSRPPDQQTQENMPAAGERAEPSSGVGESSSSSAGINERTEYMPDNTEEQIMPFLKGNKLKFDSIIYCCGNFNKKSNHNSRVLVSNLSKALSTTGKLFLQDKFLFKSVISSFFKKLRKITEFEVAIGSLITTSEIMVQFIAQKECIHLLLHLLIYWLNLPTSEKEQGLDLSLPMKTKKMWNFLMNLKLPRLTEEIDNPLELMETLQDYKNKLLNTPEDAEYFRNKRCMWKIQTKLLAYINTHPEPSEHYHKILSYMDTLKDGVKSKRLDAATYLDILLSYNSVYTPHTPPNLKSILYRITQNRWKQNSNEKSEFTVEQISPNADANTSVPFVICTPREIDTMANPFTIANVQNMVHNTLDDVEVRNIANICQPGTSDATENCMQYPQRISSFNVEPTSIQLGDLKREATQWSIDKVNINTCVLPIKPNVNAKHKDNQKNNQKHTARNLSKLLMNESQMTKQKKLFDKARHVANEARNLKLPYMIKTAEDLLKKVTNKTLRRKDVATVRNMISLEKKHRQKIINYSKQLN